MYKQKRFFGVLYFVWDCISTFYYNHFLFFSLISDVLHLIIFDHSVISF